MFRPTAVARDRELADVQRVRNGHVGPDRVRFSTQQRTARDPVRLIQHPDLAATLRGDERLALRAHRTGPPLVDAALAHPASGVFEQIDERIDLGGGGTSEWHGASDSGNSAVYSDPMARQR